VLAIAPVDDHVEAAGTDPDLEAMGPLLAQFGVSAALAVMIEGQVDWQAPTRRPGNDGMAGKFIAIARIRFVVSGLPAIGRPGRRRYRGDAAPEVAHLLCCQGAQTKALGLGRVG